MRKQGSCLEKEIMQGTMPGARRRGRPRTAWMDNTKTWTGLSMEESVRITEDRDKWRKYVHGVVNPSDRGRLKNRTGYVQCDVRNPSSSPPPKNSHSQILKSWNVDGDTLRALLWKKTILCFVHYTHNSICSLALRMRIGVYETVLCPSVCLSLHGPTTSNPLLQVCCCGPGGHEISIDCCSSGGRMPAVSRYQRTYR